MKILGIDECGRGCLAGPVVVAGCIFTDSLPKEIIEKLADSKKLTIKAREYLYDFLISNTIYQIEQEEATTIDEHGISFAQKICIEKIYNSLHEKADITIYDGNWDPIHQSDFKTQVKGDSLIKEISAASIIGKVYRDRMMIDYSKIYPEYSFEWHKGYGTKKHIQAIKKYGYTPIHRKSFNIRKI